MTDCRRYGVLFCNGFLVFGVYYFMEIPISLQNEMMNNFHSYTGSNNSNQTDCKTCLGLGEVRYNLLHSVTRWTSLVVCLPSGFLIDRLGNGRSAMLFSILPLIGSFLYTVGAMSRVPVTTPMYLLMMAGNGLLSFGDGALRFVQARVVAHSFPGATLTAMAFGAFGYSGQALTLYTAPSIATAVGIIPVMWLGIGICGFGVLCAVGLTFLLRLQISQLEEDIPKNKMLTLKEFRLLPGAYWLYILAVGLTNACWIVKQSNIPEYLQLRHGYTMTEASYITGISPLVLLLSPVLCYVLKKVDCDGIMATFFLAWMVPLYAILGYCPDINVIIIVLADGIGVTILNVMMWQLLVVLSPASYVGTLGGVMYLFGNAFSALTYVVSGYILRTSKVMDVNEALNNYQNFFLMLMIMTSAGVVCGTVMNILDGRTACALNSRIARWRQTDMETIGLMSMTEPSRQYCGTDGVNNDNTVSDDPSVKSTTCKED